MREGRRHSENDSSLAELRDLLADFTTGELSDEQNMRLEELAIESEVAWQFYIQYMFMYGTIHQKHCNFEKIQASFIPSIDDLEHKEQNSLATSNSSIFPLLEMEGDLLSSCTDTDEDWAKAPFPKNSLDGFLGRINFSFVPGLIMVIASTLILSAVVILPIYWSTRPDDPRWTVVARVTKTLESTWAQGKIGPQDGALLTAGQLLDLELGFVEIEFISGSKVVLKGPARFAITDGNASRLEFGQLAASVPQGAEGFSVQTPAMKVVDLGTEFGVKVGQDDHQRFENKEAMNVDVHVFKGEVEVEAKLASDQVEKLQLTENQAVRYNAKSEQITRIEADPESFTRQLDLTDGITAKMRIVNPSFEFPDIRTLREYQPAHGDTGRYDIQGWQYSTVDGDGNVVINGTPDHYFVTMQISPYSQVTNEALKVGPGATDGLQVAVAHICANEEPAGESKEVWLFQSLGRVQPFDLGKELTVTVDVTCRENYQPGGGDLFAKFALRTKSKPFWDEIGASGVFREALPDSGPHTIKATLPFTVDLIGEEVFVLVGVVDHRKAASGQYHFDNVQLSVRPITKE